MIQATTNIRHNGKQYKSGEIIENITKEEAKRLVNLQDAFFIGEIDDEEDDDFDYAAELEAAFDYIGLKEAAKKAGLQFAGNISTANLIELIIKEGKEEEVLDQAEGE